MIAEAIAAIRLLAQQAAAPQPIPALSDDRHAVVLVAGHIESIDRDPVPRKHAPATVAEVIAIANHFASTGPGDVVVWYDDEQVTAVLDDDGHRVETATLRFDQSAVFRRVDSLNASSWFEPPAFVRLLRIELARTLPPGVLLDVVRKLKFENGQVVNRSIGRASESLGREINAAATSAVGPIPEEVTLAVPVYSTPGRTDPIPLVCAVEVEPTRGLLQLVPLPDEVDHVLALAVAAIRAELDAGLDANVRRYNGRA